MKSGILSHPLIRRIIDKDHHVVVKVNKARENKGRGDLPVVEPNIIRGDVAFVVVILDAVIGQDDEHVHSTRKSMQHYSHKRINPFFWVVSKVNNPASVELKWNSSL
jgi:hypothetical protein